MLMNEFNFAFAPAIIMADASWKVVLILFSSSKEEITRLLATEFHPKLQLSTEPGVLIPFYSNTRELKVSDHKRTSYCSQNKID